MQAIEERVDTLEDVLRHYIIHTEASQARTDAAITRLSEEIDKLKDEMREFKDEMREFKDEMRQDRKEMNKQWGALSQKMGTLDEDLIAPATRPVLSKYFKCEPKNRSIRNLRRINGDSFEVDVLVACDDRVFMIEVRSSPRSEHVNEIIRKTKRLKKFFPEYNDKEIIPIFGSIIFPENVINYATKKGLYLMAYREWEYMDILNFDEIQENIKNG